MRNLFLVLALVLVYIGAIYYNSDKIITAICIFLTTIILYSYVISKIFKGN